MDDDVDVEWCASRVYHIERDGERRDMKNASERRRRRRRRMIAVETRALRSAQAAAASTTPRLACSPGGMGDLGMAGKAVVKSIDSTRWACSPRS